MLPDIPSLPDAVIAVHWTGAVVGLGAAVLADGLGLGLLLTAWTGPSPGAFRGLHRAILLALAIMIATGGALIYLRQGTWCARLDDPLMYTFGMVCLPAKLLAKLMAMGALLCIALLIGRFVLPLARRPERPLLPHLTDFEIARAALIGSGSLTCWLTLISIPLVTPLHHWRLAELIGGVVLLWIGVSIVVLLSLQVFKRILIITRTTVIAKRRAPPKPPAIRFWRWVPWLRPSLPLLAPLVVLTHGLLGLVWAPYGSGLIAIAAALAAVVWVCCCYRVTPPVLPAIAWPRLGMTRARANLILLLAAALWGSGNVAQKTVLDHLGSFTVVGMRGLLAAVVVLPIALAEVRRTRPYAPGDWRLLASVALLFALGTILSQLGFSGTSVTNAGFLINTSTVFTPILALIVYRVRPRAVVWPAVVVTMAGIWLLGGASVASLSRGDGLCVLAAATYALWIIQIGVLVQRTGRPVLAALGQFAVAGVLGLGIGLGTESISAANLLAAAPDLVFLGVVSTGAGFLLAAIAQQHTPAADASILMSAESLFGALAATLILGEALTPVRMLGAGLLLVAIILVQLPDWQPRPAAETQSPARRSHPAALPSPA